MLKRPPAHVRKDRTLREVAYPVVELLHPIGQINSIVVSDLGQDCPPHYHQELYETFVCLEGYIRLVITNYYGGHEQEHILLPGQSLTVVPMTFHALQATPHSRYLELRSNLYRYNENDKIFRDLDSESTIAKLNSRATLE